MHIDSFAGEVYKTDWILFREVFEMGAIITIIDKNAKAAWFGKLSILANLVALAFACPVYFYFVNDKYVASSLFSTVCLFFSIVAFYCWGTKMTLGRDDNLIDNLNQTSFALIALACFAILGHYLQWFIENPEINANPLLLLWLGVSFIVNFIFLLALAFVFDAG